MGADKDIVASRAVEPIYFAAPYREDGDVTPSPYQNAAVEYRVARRHAIIGDAPGLGKSAEALLFGNSIGAKHTLIVCPASLRLNWEREVKMWTTIGGATTYPVLKSKDGVSLEHNFVIISYALLRNKSIFNALMEVEWDHMILDEAHALKDPKGNVSTKAICGWVQLGKYIEGLADAAERMTLLSGTLMPNQPIEAYNAVRLCDHSALDYMSVDAFREEYYEQGSGMVRGPVLIKQDSDGNPLADPYFVNKLHHSKEVRNVPRNLDDLQYRLRKNVMVRRLKEDVLKQLPPKHWHPFPVETTADIRRALKHPGWDQVQKLYEMDPAAFDTGIPVDGAVSTAMRELGEAKAPVVADYIEELLNGGVEKIVVGVWHVNPSEKGVAGTGKSVARYIYDRLAKYGIVYMDGSTSARKKQEAVDAFQNLEEIRVIEGQLAAIGEGWTLTAAQDGVLAEFWWVPGKNDQFLDRMHRRGQEGGYVLGHVPTVPGSMDERIIGTVVEKDRNIHLALDA